MTHASGEIRVRFEASSRAYLIAPNTRCLARSMGAASGGLIVRPEVPVRVSGQLAPIH